MGRIAHLLDREVSYGFEGGPEYKTNVTDLENGFEDRDASWKYPKHKYEASFENLNNETQGLIIDVFHACRGRAHSFLFKDHNDYEADHEPLAAATGTTNKVQLYVTYTFGSAYTIRPVFALGDDVVVLDASNNPVAGSFNLLTGEFTPSANWGAGPYYWSGTFYVWVRFDDDYNSMTINAWRDFSANVSLQEDPMVITALNVPASWDG